MDPVTNILAILLIGSVALVAAWMPALKAPRIDPLIALREE
jgi:ABC-type antimicrobial peptide transport system permease subunit